jgi:Ca2+-binding RTX toxin-like protein
MSVRRTFAVPAVCALASSILVVFSPPAGAAPPRCFGEPATRVGTRGADEIVGTRRNDVIFARGGDDIVFGRGGRDLICGGRGEDDLVGGVGNDKLDGGPGASNSYLGGGGDDLLRGLVGDGDDANYSDAPRAVVVDLADHRATGEGHDTLRGMEIVVGSRGHGDTLRGNGRGNLLLGLSGSDTLVGRGGRDYLAADKGNDSIRGGSELDIVDYFFAGSSSGVQVDLAAGTGGNSDLGSDALSGIEWVWGTNRSDSLVGDGQANILDAMGGADSVSGGGDDDLMSGGAGDDSIDGDAGSDAVDFSFFNPNAGAPAGVDADLQGGSSTGQGQDTLVELEDAFGTDHADTLIGTTGPNVLLALLGNDDLSGDAGNDSLWGHGGTDTGDGGDGSDACIEIETMQNCESTDPPAVASRRAPTLDQRRPALRF